jgi:hypothetical protein
MAHVPSFARRLLLAAGLTLGAVAPAALGVLPAVAAAPPTLTILGVSPGGTQADVTATSSVPVAITYSVHVAPARVVPGGTVAAGTLAASAPALRQIDGVLAPVTGVLDPGTPLHYDTKHIFRLTGLKPNTAYDLNIAGTTEAGEHLTAHARFTTLKQRVRLTLDTITVTDDGDVIGSGEPTWFWSVGWATASLKDCYPKSAGHCREGSASEGTIFPNAGAGKTYSYVFAEENFKPMPGPGAGEEDFTTMPTSFFLHAAAKESDSFLQSALDAFFDGYAQLGDGSSGLRWDVPQGVEGDRKQVTMAANDGNFKSVLHFTFQVFYDNQTYTPNEGRVYSTSK